MNDEGLRHWQAGRIEQAARCFERAVAANPAHAPSCNSLAAALLRTGRGDEAVGWFRRAGELQPEHVDYQVNLAEALTLGGSPAASVEVLREALRRQPGHARAHSFLLRPLLELCAWDELERELGLFTDAWERDPEGAWLAVLLPFVSLLLPMPAAMRLAIARRHAASLAQQVAGEPSLPRPARPARARLRIGYASADFHDHATAHLAAGLFEAHDRGRFEVHAYSFGPDDGSPWRARLVQAFDRFSDVSREPARMTAQRIALDGIDLLVDLKGYTGDCRPEIFAYRPAPVQASWLGYPSSTGARAIDYVIADRVVLPEEDLASFTEQPAWLPQCYQPNDRRRPIAASVPGRAQCGLPETGFVFCCFNSHNKLGRPVFESWMRILAAVPGSVLWLLSGAGEARLRSAAAAAGTDPSRLRFSPKIPLSDHLARHALADLFLDTPCYNAHTTASDALWAGLPLLTWPGPAFAGRVAASLLHAIGLAELVARDAAQYEARAVELARNPDRLRAIRSKLAANRLTAPLFDTEAFARGLERAYGEMWRRHAAGELPGPVAA